MDPLPLNLRDIPFAMMLPKLPLPEDGKRSFLQNFETVKARDEALPLAMQAVNSFFVASQVNSTKKKKVMKSEAAYTLDGLNVNDQMVWGFNAPFLWWISPKIIHQLYAECISFFQHCKIAVGTGLFLTTQATVVNCLSDVTLMDLNPNMLKVCEQRLLKARSSGTERITTNAKNNKVETQQENHHRRRPALVVNKVARDILKPAPPSSTTCSLGGTGTDANNKKKFGLIAANFLLHCLHGGNETTKMTLWNIAKMLDETEGVFFGSTILLGHKLHNNHHNYNNNNNDDNNDLTEQEQQQEEEWHIPEAALDTNLLYNQVGVFGNLADSMLGIQSALEEVFEDVDIICIGFCAVWKAKRPRKSPFTVGHLPCGGVAAA